MYLRVIIPIKNNKAQSSAQTATFARVHAYFSTRHYGYFSDIIQGIRDTKYYSSDLSLNDNVTQSPVICRFYKNEKIIASVVTACSNIDEESRIFGPYIDGEIPKDQVQRTEYIDVSDVLTTTEI